MSRVYVGTSGWVYGDWQGRFYPSDLPQKKWLEFYSKNFGTVEINSTFYHAAKPKTFENWAAVVPDGFIFAVKASRFISHIKRLNVPRDSIKYQLESVAVLGKKLGPLLLQCPPRWKADVKRLKKFLVHCSQFTVHSNKTVNRQLTTENRLAFEFRDPSWFSETIYEVLKKHNAALVIAESGRYWPSDEVITTDFTYLRFHGEGGSYATKYTDDELKEWAKKIKKWQKSRIDVYAYFNNDVGGFAIDNAKSLIDLVT